jgi:hypothetical protein
VSCGSYRAPADDESACSRRWIDMAIQNGTVNTANCELHVLQADTKETAKLDPASHKKNCLN